MWTAIEERFLDQPDDRLAEQAKDVVNTVKVSMMAEALGQRLLSIQRGVPLVGGIHATARFAAGIDVVEVPPNDVSKVLAPIGWNYIHALLVSRGTLSVAAARRSLSAYEREHMCDTLADEVTRHQAKAFNVKTKGLRSYLKLVGALGPFGIYHVLHLLGVDLGNSTIAGGMTTIALFTYLVDRWGPGATDNASARETAESLRGYMDLVSPESSLLNDNCSCRSAATTLAGCRAQGGCRRRRPRRGQG